MMMMMMMMIVMMMMVMKMMQFSIVYGKFQHSYGRLVGSSKLFTGSLRYVREV
jgi:hypothetical protein